MAVPDPTAVPPAASPSLAGLAADAGPLSLAGRGALTRGDQRRRWLRGQRFAVEDYLRLLPGLAPDADALLDLLYCEFTLREELGEHPTADEYARRFPSVAEPFARLIRLHRALETGTDLRSLAAAP